MSLCTCDKFEHTDDCPAYGEQIFGNKESVENYQMLMSYVFENYKTLTVGEARLRLGFPVGDKKFCENCGGTIQVMCFLGQNYCSENCRKDLEERIP